jgi:transcriptional regulator with XRE-family HTH domain
MWRAERLLSTRRLAELAGTSNKTIVQIENGRQTASFVTIEKICRALEVEPRDVREFAMALDARAGGTPDDLRVDTLATGALTHACCVGARPGLLSLTRRLLAEETYGVTTVIRLEVSVEQIVALRPDVLIIDLDGLSADTLVHDLRSNPVTCRIPIVLTAQQTQRLDDVVTELSSGRSGEHVPIHAAPFSRDLSALVTAIEAAIRE